MFDTTATRSLVFCLAAAAVGVLALGAAADDPGPLTVVELDSDKLQWNTVPKEGFEGVRFHLLSMDAATGGSEILLEVSANSVLPMHAHASDEIYVSISGAYTHRLESGEEFEASGPTYVSLKAGTNHEIVTKDETCLIYVRYSGPSDMTFPNHEH